MEKTKKDPFKYYAATLALLERDIENLLLDEPIKHCRKYVMLGRWLIEKRQDAFGRTPVILVNGIEKFIKEAANKKVMDLYRKCSNYYGQAEINKQIRKGIISLN
jgi:hypothetical protein